MGGFGEGLRRGWGRVGEGLGEFKKPLFDKNHQPTLDLSAVRQLEDIAPVLLGRQNLRPFHPPRGVLELFGPKVGNGVENEFPGPSGPGAPKS